MNRLVSMKIDRLKQAIKVHTKLDNYDKKLWILFEFILIDV